MKVKFEITYDAGKLSKEIKNIVKDFLKNTGEAFVVGSKKAIEGGQFEKISEFTKMIRKGGYSPHGGKKAVTHSKPLIHRGKFLKGLKLLKNGDISVHKYALNHLPDDIFDMSEESIVTQVAAEEKTKRGEAYTIVSNSFTKEYPYIIGKKVPIRNWFRMDKDLAKKSIVKFKKSLKDNFERKMSQKFTRFKA